jgi:hypothetical protein
MTARKFKLAPRDRDELFVYTPESNSGEVEITKFIYYKSATYKQVTGEHRGAPFTDEWGVYRSNDGLCFVLSGRNSTENLECYLNEKNTCWMRTWKAAHTELMQRLTRQASYLKKEHERFVEMIERASRMMEPARKEPKRRASRAKRSSLSPAEKQQRNGTWKGHKK